MVTKVEREAGYRAKVRLGSPVPEEEIDAILEAAEAARGGDFRWLIEAPGQRYLGAHNFASGHYEFRWTKGHDDALFFKSKEQADLVMMSIRQLAPALFGFEVTLGNAWPVEHGWVASVPPKAEGV